MKEGIVKTLAEGKGYGFISIQGQKKDLFFHATNLKNVKFADLRSGDKVSFEIEEGNRGPFAVEINLVS